MALAKLVILLLTTVVLNSIHSNAEVSVIHKHRKNLWNVISVPPRSSNIPPTNAPYFSIIHDSISPILSPFSSPITPPSGAPIPSSIPSSSDSSIQPISSGSIPLTGLDDSSTYNVMSFGAVGDGKTQDTNAFSSAWNSACDQLQQSVLLVPKGYSFFVGPIRFSGPCRNQLIFKIEGNILAPQDPNSWPSNFKESWLLFYKVDGLKVQGNGLINCRGDNWWNRNGVKPAALRFFGCSSLTIQGYSVQSKLKVINSPQFHFAIDSCNHVTIDSISISSPATSPNTDGIHIESNDVLVQNSDISNGDDCISMGDGSQNIKIDHVNCLNGHGISIGSLGAQNSHGSVANVNVTNSFIGSSTNGLRIKTWQGGSGTVSSITYRNIRMDKVRYPIILDQFYCDSVNDCKTQTSNLAISGVTYDTIYGSYIADKPPVYLACSASVACVGITIANMNLQPAAISKEVISEAYCSNSYGKLIAPIVPPVSCLQQQSSKKVQDL